MENKRNPFPRYSIWIQLTVLTILMLCVSLPAQDEPFSWLGPDGEILPFTSPDEMEAFLETAMVIEIKRIDMGVTHPMKLLLEKDGVRLHAIFRNLDEFKGVWNAPSGPKINFHDSCYYELAAYRLSRLLAINRVPPVVKRTFRREDFRRGKDFGKLAKSCKGTLQAWVEDAMTEIERRKRQQTPPDITRWLAECQKMFLFDSLTFNEDRNLGNVLIGPEWRIWLIDSTRAFRPYRELKNPEGVKRCDPVVWERLRSIQPETLRAELGDVLQQRVLDCLIARHQALVEYIQQLIAEHGEPVVLAGFR